MSNSEKESNSAPIMEYKITLNGYKCFRGCTCFDRIMPINIIIGKNNSGKSSLIELIEFVNNPSPTFLSTGRDRSYAEVHIQREVTREELAGFPLEEGLVKLQGVNEYLHLFSYDVQNNVFAVQSAVNRKGVALELNVAIKAHFLKIIAERNIKPESVTTEDISIKEDGSNATRIVRRIITDSMSPISRDVIETELLNDLNSIVNPDIEFTKIEVQTINKSNKSSENPRWEIFFVDRQDKRVRLSRMGSGIKTVLLVLLNLIIAPLDYKDDERFIFAFEELENNLHPALQRRLFEYIKKYSEKHGCYFFLTTHSNVVIDVFGTYEHAQIIHVENDGTHSTTRTVLHDEDSKKVLKDLGVKASDLLQSNGVIWVEGPSDRNYLNKWIQLKASDLQEGLHYSIMFYGGDIRSNLTFDENWVKKNLIPMLKINTNAFIIMDRDGEDEKTELSESKRRVIKEIGEGNYWVTKGREIENYLSGKVVKDWLLERHKGKHKKEIAKFTNEKDTKLKGNISNVSENLFSYTNKTFHSSQIAEFIDKDSLEVLDLKEKLDELIKCIRAWNE